MKARRQSYAQRQHKDTRTDSVKNCQIRVFRLAPTTFLTPTSFALSNDLAVERLMKLMPARINNSKDTAERI